MTLGHRGRSSAAVALATGLSLFLIPPASRAEPSGAASTHAARTAPTLVARSRGAVVTPAFDVNRKGVGFAVWVDEVGGRYTVMAARRTPKGHWSGPQRVSRAFPWAGRKSWAWGGRPDVAVDGRGVATAVWAEPKGGQLRIRTADFRGRGGWSRPTSVSAKGDPSSFPDVEVSADGHGVLLWSSNYPSTTDADYTLMTSYRERRGGWGAPQQLGPDPAWRMASRPASPAIDDRGVATVAWDEEHRTLGNTGRVQLATRSATTGWVTQTMFDGSNHGHGPRVDTTPQGQLTLAWESYDRVLAQHRDPSGAWGTPETLTWPPGYLPNLLGAGVADSGLSAVYVESVETATSRVQPLVLVQGTPGAQWSTEAVADPVTLYSAPAYEEGFEVGPLGDVSVTWMVQDPNPRRWYWTGFRHRLPDGTWLPASRVGRFAADPDLATDGRGRVGIVYGEGRAQHCCSTLAARLLTAG